MNIKLLSDRVLVNPDEMETKTESGIIIPGDSKQLPTSGIVVATGPGTKDYPMEVKVGQKVLFGKYQGNEFPYQGTEYLEMRSRDILAILEE